MELSLLENVIVELTEKISGARISKIHQPAADLFIFRLWNGSENLKLLLSAAPGNSRLHLTEQNFANPFTPPRFCQLLRSRISRILTISQLNHDRIVQLECTGPKGLCRLLVELTGRSSNLILVAEDGRIIDALKRVQSSQQRVIAAGQMYVLPEPQKSREVQRREPKNIPPENASVSLAVEKLYTQNQRLKKEKDLRGLIEETLKKAQKKLQRRLKNIEQEQVNQQGYEQYKQRGELILANLYQINKGLERIELENKYRQPPTPETIELDPLLNPQKNAEKYFQKYKKARRGLEHSARRLEETRLEL
ncbi:MAG: NFACT family protein, partial [Desulfuromonadales bacterium]|nr:NFACT family protein [Desulfuromonadales bacterium]